MKLRTRFAYALFPPDVWSPLLWELQLARVRASNALLPSYRRLLRRSRHTRPLRIHLGCGDRIQPDWINVDALRSRGVDLVWDARYGLPFDNDSVELIYSEHFLEHLSQWEAMAVLRECQRILAPGGTARVGVPDARIYLDAYVEHRDEFFKQCERLGGASEPFVTPMQVINQMFRMGGSHKYAWDFETLELALKRAGFQEITSWDPGAASSALLCLDDPEHAFETLYVEARKAPADAPLKDGTI